MIRSTPACLLLAAFAMTAAYVPSSAQTTHEFEATEYYNTFSFAHPPALRIRPGDRVVTRTIDAGGQDWNGNQVGPGAQPADRPVLRPREQRRVTSSSYDSRRSSRTATGPTPTRCWHRTQRIRRSYATRANMSSSGNGGTWTPRPVCPDRLRPPCGHRVSRFRSDRCSVVSA